MIGQPIIASNGYSLHSGDTAIYDQRNGVFALYSNISINQIYTDGCRFDDELVCLTIKMQLL